MSSSSNGALCSVLDMAEVEFNASAFLPPGMSSSHSFGSGKAGMVESFCCSMEDEVYLDHQASAVSTSLDVSLPDYMMPAKDGSVLEPSGNSARYCG